MFIYKPNSVPFIHIMKRKTIKQTTKKSKTKAMITIITIVVVPFDFDGIVDVVSVLEFISSFFEGSGEVTELAIIVSLVVIVVAAVVLLVVVVLSALSIGEMSYI